MLQSIDGENSAQVSISRFQLELRLAVEDVLRYTRQQRTDLLSKGLSDRGAALRLLLMQYLKASHHSPWVLPHRQALQNDSSYPRLR